LPSTAAFSGGREPAARHPCRWSLRTPPARRCGTLAGEFLRFCRLVFTGFVVLGWLFPLFGVEDFCGAVCASISCFGAFLRGQGRRSTFWRDAFAIAAQQTWRGLGGFGPQARVPCFLTSRAICRESPLFVLQAPSLADQITERRAWAHAWDQQVDRLGVSCFGPSRRGPDVPSRVRVAAAMLRVQSSCPPVIFGFLR